VARLGLRATATLISAVTLFLLVNVTGAFAEAGSRWLILTSIETIKTTEELPVSLTGEMVGKETLLTKLVGVKFEKTCSAVEITGLKLEGESSIAPGAKLKFTGCKIFINGVESKVCIPHTSGAPAGTLETNKLRGDLGLHPLKNAKGEFIKNEKGEIILHGPIRLDPEAGETYMTLELGTGECSVGEKVPILGTFYAHDVEGGGIETHRVKHLIEEGPGTAVWIISKTEEHKVILDGQALLYLNGAHSGLKWGGMIG
jgi:hypothetical protein